MTNNSKKEEITEEEKTALFEKCLFYATQFAENHLSGTALEYMRAREKVTELGLEEEYRKWFFGEK